MRVLFLTHRLPYAPNRGDRVRAFHILRGLSERVDVDLLSLVHDPDEEGHAHDLRGLARSVTTLRVSRGRNLLRALVALPGPTPLTHALLDSPDLSATVAQLARFRCPDVVLAYCSGMARLALGPLKSCPMILDMVDVDSEKWRQLAETTVGPKQWVYRREARRLAAFEQRAMRHASATLVVNEREAAVASGIAPDARVIVVSNGIDLSTLAPPEPARDACEIVFCGVMNYEPNEQGVLWFLQDVWPTVKRLHERARFVIVGANPTARLQRACAGDARVSVTGSVPDVRQYLWRASVSVAPLLLARGLQNKVLEAAAAGLPAVVTPNVFAGLPGHVAPACVVADSASAFADAVVALLHESPRARRERVARADLRPLSWNTSLAPLWDVLEAAARQRPTQAA